MTVHSAIWREILLRRYYNASQKRESTLLYVCISVIHFPMGKIIIEILDYVLSCTFLKIS